MNSLRSTSILVGAIFIVATVSALLAAFVDPILASPTFLLLVGLNPNQITVGAVFYIVAAVTSASIPIFLYQSIRRTHPGLALGSVIFRAIEAVFYLVAVVSLLAVIAVGQKVVVGTDESNGMFTVLGGLLLKVREQATLLGVVAFCIGAGMYYWVFVQSRLLPLWLSLWGLVGVVLMLVACGLSLFSGNPITGYTLLVLPIALQEMVLALWLIFRGMRAPQPTASDAA